MQVYDEKSANTVASEERVYRTWERAEKNRILNMTNTVKKQEAWKRLFPQMERSDDYLNGLVF